jgi:hypothetical protein
LRKISNGIINLAPVDRWKSDLYQYLVYDKFDLFKRYEDWELKGWQKLGKKEWIKDRILEFNKVKICKKVGSGNRILDHSIADNDIISKVY